jgi:hypothetical protein
MSNWDLAMNKTARTLIAAAILALPGMASANLILDSTIHLSAQGFGNAPRDLTVQQVGNSPNPNGTESGCVGFVGATFTVGPTGCPTTDATIMPNGVIPNGGDEPNPHGDNNKFGAPTLASLGITNASQIGILFNPTEPGGDSINVLDITLGIYSSTGVRLASIDGSQNFASTDPGNGVAGFTFVIDATQQALLNAAIFTPGGFGADRLALQSTLTDVAGGPDSFLIFNRDISACTVNCVPLRVPEPHTLALIGLGFLVFAALRRRRIGEK